MPMHRDRGRYDSFTFVPAARYTAVMTPDQPMSVPPAESPELSPVDRVIRYHVRTKHHFHRYARSLGFLDWANQPDPFRRFEGAPLISLPLLAPDDDPRSPSYDDIFRPGAVQARPVGVQTLSRFLELALALSAWKRAGDSQWALRSNPSSGNLHPTEGYLVLPSLDHPELSAGLYHYAPKEHGLERRAEFSERSLARLFSPFPGGAFFVGFSSVHWREAWKYGERAYRYCNHDVGHAIASARMAAATLGWTMVLLDGTDQSTVAALLGTDRRSDFVHAEAEHADCVAVVWPNDAGCPESPTGSQAAEMPSFLDAEEVSQLVDAKWVGQANRLSRDQPVAWEIIDDAAEAAWKPTLERVTVAWGERPFGAIDRPTPQVSDGAGLGRPTAAQIIRQRRSAVAFDGVTSITAATFFRMMQRVMPAAHLPCLDRPMPWDVVRWPPAIHLLLFVHRVEGLMPGLYVLVRDPVKLTVLQQAMNPELDWESPPGCPAGLPLYWLLQGDAKRLAAQVSCHQDIAGDSAFSLGMVAEFEGLLHDRGAWWYPRLFWEAGLVGQVLYLEAEAAGVRGTGIGCYFDDPVHEIVGIKGLSIQSMYHFTIGGAVEDVRLQTLAPYHHVQRRSR